MAMVSGLFEARSGQGRLQDSFGCLPGTGQCVKESEQQCHPGRLSATERWDDLRTIAHVCMPLRDVRTFVCVCVCVCVRVGGACACACECVCVGVCLSQCVFVWQPAYCFSPRAPSMTRSKTMRRTVHGFLATVPCQMHLPR